MIRYDRAEQSPIRTAVEFRAGPGVVGIVGARGNGDEVGDDPPLGLTDDTFRGLGMGEREEHRHEQVKRHGKDKPRAEELPGFAFQSFDIDMP